jgi:hypothetical protein
MEELDGLIIILIDLYVPAFTSRFYRGETALQFSENITVFAICCIYTCINGKEG